MPTSVAIAGGQMGRRAAKPDWRAVLRRALRRSSELAGAVMLFAAMVFLALALVSYVGFDRVLGYKIGTGLIEQNPVPAVFKKNNPKKTPLQLEIDWRKPLLLDLKIRPSKLFLGGITEEGEEEEVDFQWHCKNGLQANI